VKAVGKLIVRINCPTCSTATELPIGGAASLPLNFDLRDVVEQYHKGTPIAAYHTTYFVLKVSLCRY
jgi:hypothetical protein